MIAAIFVELDDKNPLTFVPVPLSSRLDYFSSFLCRTTLTDEAKWRQRQDKKTYKGKRKRNLARENSLKKVCHSVELYPNRRMTLHFKASFKRPCVCPFFTRRGVRTVRSATQKRNIQRGTAAWGKIGQQLSLTGMQWSVPIRNRQTVDSRRERQTAII